jgi:hypothetical protein
MLEKCIGALTKAMPNHGASAIGREKRKTSVEKERKKIERKK